MARKLSTWSKRVKCELIKRDMSIAELALAIGRTREYTSMIVHGRCYSDAAVKDISDVLNIPNSACSDDG